MRRPPHRDPARIRHGRLLLVACAVSAVALWGCETPRQAAPASPSPTDFPTPMPAPHATGSPLERVTDASPVPGSACEDLVEDGWEAADCLVFRMAGGTAAAITEWTPGSGVVPTWRVRVAHQHEDAWQATFLAVGEEDRWGEVRLGTLTDGQHEAIVIGYRYTGSGSLLDYDVLTWPPDGTLDIVWHRAGLSHGSVRIGAGQVEEFEADFPGGEPNCCPPRFAHRVLSYTGEGLEVVTDDYVAVEAVPPSEL